MSTGFWLNYFLALTIVALMLGGLYITVRGLARGRLLASAHRRMVTVLESTMLSQHASVHVVKVGAKYMLVGGSNGNVSMLTELPPEDVESWLVAERESLAASRSMLNPARWVRPRNQ
ncbi:MAG: flagellar biosynthetic protein FliO [Candidatus Eremiobacteraeota bacterium]|nr:flagellar biosynthetic protein FliO [Candidatus Eremiobacteraeota bacterium]MBV8720529.1 flagellar biosynthetic protein FliO [Candidatus Eremiobacteraeota bacterium]